MPSVTERTEYSSSSAGTWSTSSMALYAASTGPVPTDACDLITPVGAAEAHRGRGDALRSAGDLDALEREELVLRLGVVVHQGLEVGVGHGLAPLGERLEARRRCGASAASSNEYPRSTRRAASAARPECLPRTRLVCVAPTLSGRMIS